MAGTDMEGKASAFDAIRSHYPAPLGEAEMLLGRPLEPVERERLAWAAIARLLEFKAPSDGGLSLEALGSSVSDADFNRAACARFLEAFQDGAPVWADALWAACRGFSEPFGGRCEACGGELDAPDSDGCCAFAACPHCGAEALILRPEGHAGFDWDMRALFFPASRTLLALTMLTAGEWAQKEDDADAE